MKIKVENDYGCLKLSIDGFVCTLVDAASCRVFTKLEKMLLNQSSLYDMSYFEIDSDDRKVLVYSATTADGNMSRIFPAFIMSVKTILDEDSMLVRLYNLFVEKRFQILFHDAVK